MKDYDKQDLITNWYLYTTLIESNRRTGSSAFDETAVEKSVVCACDLEPAKTSLFLAGKPGVLEVHHLQMQPFQLLSPLLMNTPWSKINKIFTRDNNLQILRLMEYIRSCLEVVYLMLLSCQWCRRFLTPQSSDCTIHAAALLTIAPVSPVVDQSRMNQSFVLVIPYWLTRMNPICSIIFLHVLSIVVPSLAIGHYSSTITRDNSFTQPLLLLHHC